METGEMTDDADGNTWEDGKGMAMVHWGFARLFQGTMYLDTKNISVSVYYILKSSNPFLVPT